MSLLVEHVKRKLSKHTGFQWELVINENRANLISVLGRGRNWARVSMHRMFLEAPENVIRALAHYVQAKDKLAFTIIRSYICDNIHRYDYSHRIDPRSLDSRGRIYDLKEMFERLNREYFDDELQLRITWHNQLPKKKCTRIVYGQYFHMLRLIKINRFMDDKKIPEYFVNFVIYHEMLHSVVPPYVDEKGISRIHSREFKVKEKEFRFYKEAKKWEQEFRHSFFAEWN